MEITSKPDDMGRCSFTLFWFADYHPGHPKGEHRHAERAQCFFADPKRWAARCRRVDYLTA